MTRVIGWSIARSTLPRLTQRVLLARRTPAVGCLLLLTVFAAGIALSQRLLPLQNANRPGGLASHMLSWDGRIYYNVMRHGYVWDPMHGVLVGHYQNIAFFPLQPLLERLVMLVAGTPAPALVIFLSLACGFASIFAFDRLAALVLAPAAARWATLFYALWPACAFYTMGYPTGLISLCILGGLRAHLRGHWWRSALWLGIGSAAAPTVVFVFVALALDRAWDWARRRAPMREIPPLLLWGTLGITGLLGFMAWQSVRFHDPFAFTKAQTAWGTTPPFRDRLHRLTSWAWYTQQAHAGIAEISAGRALMHHGGAILPAAIDIEAGLQRWINGIAMIFAVCGLAFASIILAARHRIVAVAGWVVLAGYFWFIFSTNQNMLSVPRLVFPAIAIFLGLGWAASRGRGLGYLVLGFWGLVSMLEVAFAAAGYWVV